MFLRTFLQRLWHLPRNAAILLITGYQKTLSPDHGPLKALFPYGCCVHELTCSQYGKMVMRERGFVIGTLLAAKRVLGCHPWKKPSAEKIRKIIG